MRAPVSWIGDYADLPAEATVEELTRRLTMLGLKLEAIHDAGAEITGPLVVGRVLSAEPEPQRNGKTINWCAVDVGDANGTGEPQGIVCGAHNFGPGDLVVVCLPGAVLPGPFAISARKTYGHLSAGMICSATELGLPEAAAGGIIVLPPGSAEPGADALGVLGLDDPVIEFEINPDRAYALSLRGVAREAALAFGAAYVDPAERATPPADDAGYPVTVTDPDGCPVFVTRTVTGLDPTAVTPDWMARRLVQCGMRPVSLGVDVTNYVMLELGQPLHGYDRATLRGPLGVRRATAGERLTTLDHVDRALDLGDLLIVDDRGPIGLAGVMGGLATELSATTTDVVLEAAHFAAAGVFRSQRRHKLPSEASRRFERGVDPRLPAYAADRAATLLAELGGGVVAPGVSVVGQAPPPPVVTLDADLPERVTGMPIDAATTVAHLEAVGCEVVDAGAGRLAVTPPSWRPDITDPYDLVEEVARIVGYDRVPSVLPSAPAGAGLSVEQTLRRRVGLVLAGGGWTEAIGYPFVGDADWERLGLPEDDPRRQTLRIVNPLNAEEPQLTTTLLPGLLRALSRNVGRAMTDVALFEHGLVFVPTGNESAPILGVDRRPTDDEWATLTKAVPPQPLRLALALTGRREPDGWWGPGRDGGWADVIGALRDVAASVGVPLQVGAAQRAPWHPGRCAELRVGEALVGYAGELHPRVCRSYGLPPRAAAAEIDLDVLLEHAVAVVPGPTFSSYPVAKEDVALVVDASVPASSVEAALREGAGELLESIRLFDVYTGEQVGAGRRSLAYALRFRAPDRTLSEGEAGRLRDAAVAVATERTGAVRRS